jgi:hypothetical protein
MSVEPWGEKITVSIYTTDPSESERLTNWIARSYPPFNHPSIAFVGMRVDVVQDEPIDAGGT